MNGVKCPHCGKLILDIEPYIVADKVYHTWCWEEMEKSKQKTERVKKLVEIAYGKEKKT